MSFQSSLSGYFVAMHHRNWDEVNENQDSGLNNYVVYDPPRSVQRPEHGKITVSYSYNDEENVDAEAEEFIKFKHKKFELSKLMSTRSS